MGDEKWTLVIKGKNKLFELKINELLHFKDLILLFVRRDFVSQFKQTILGPLWYFIQPLFSTIVFTIIFGNIAKIPTDGIPQPLFYMSGLIIWNYFSTCLVSTSNTFVLNAGVFGKVYFPRLTVPISTVISSFFKFTIQFCMFLLIYLFFYFKGAPIRPTVYVLLFPLLLIQSALLGLGLGIIISSLTTRYRDLSFLVTFGMQLWMYATPIVYPLSKIPEKWRWIFAFNPMATVVETVRYGLIGKGTINPTYLAGSFAFTLGVILIGIIMFNRVEKSFMDRV